MDLSLTQCNDGHLTDLVRISKETFIEAFSHMNDPEDFRDYIDKAFCSDTIAREMKCPGAYFYFVYLENDLAGYFKINTAGAQTDINDKNSLEIERIYVDKGFQGMKIGHWMIDAIKDLARDFGVTYLWLGVWEKNGDAIRFYQKHGFQKFGEHPYFIGKDEQTDWLMRCDIPTL